MMFKDQLQKILLVVATMVMITSAMKCHKLISTSGSVGNIGATSTTNTILETGQYVVTTTRNTRSKKVQSLIERLNGSSNIQYSVKSFTATLVPKDVKKVSVASQELTINVRGQRLYITNALSTPIVTYQQFSVIKKR